MQASKDAFLFRFNSCERWSATRNVKGPSRWFTNTKDLLFEGV